MPIDVYQAVTDRIVAALEEGTVPWRKPWRAPAGAHHNPISGTFYRGVNPFLLELTAQTAGYSDPRWVTFRQAKVKGGWVKKGEKSTMVVFWKILRRANEETAEDAARTRGVSLLRYYNVFNVDQVEDLPIEPLVEREPVDSIDTCASLVDAYRDGPRIRYVPSDRAFYNHVDDVVTMPSLEQWDDAQLHYSTLFHELVHSTGHESRLARTLGTPFGSETYAQEELTAELGAAMLCAIAGIEPQTIDQAAAYIANWLKALKDDRKLVVTAAGRAQRAVDRIVGEEAPNEAPQAEAA